MALTMGSGKRDSVDEAFFHRQVLVGTERVNGWPDIKPGDVLNGRGQATYKFVKALGNGQYGKVYLVEQRIETKDEQGEVKRQMQSCVLKVFKYDSLEPPFWLTNGFEDEVLTLLMVRGIPHTITHIEHFQDLKFGPFIVSSPYCPRGDMEKYLEEQRLKPGVKKFPYKQVVKYIYQLAVALKGMHERHIYHADLAPRNILFLNDDNLIISDFGISIDGVPRDHKGPGGKPRSVTDAPETDTETKQGTLTAQQYGKVDAYALGAVAYLLLLPHDYRDIEHRVVKESEEFSDYQKWMRKEVQNCSTEDLEAKITKCYSDDKSARAVDKLAGVVAMLLKEDADQRMSVVVAERELKPIAARSEAVEASRVTLFVALVLMGIQFYGAYESWNPKFVAWGLLPFHFVAQQVVKSRYGETVSCGGKTRKIQEGDVRFVGKVAFAAALAFMIPAYIWDGILWRQINHMTLFILDMVGAAIVALLFAIKVFVLLRLNGHPLERKQVYLRKYMSTVESVCIFAVGNLEMYQFYADGLGDFVVGVTVVFTVIADMLGALWIICTLLTLMGSLVWRLKRPKKSLVVPIAPAA